jgi:hypothetical protein
MLKRLVDKAETMFAYCIVGLMVGGFPLFLFIHAITTVAE